LVMSNLHAHDVTDLVLYAYLSSVKPVKFYVD
jgi:hypothetical protein